MIGREYGIGLEVAQRAVYGVTKGWRPRAEDYQPSIDRPLFLRLPQHAGGHNWIRLDGVTAINFVPDTVDPDLELVQIERRETDESVREQNQMLRAALCTCSATARHIGCPIHGGEIAPRPRECPT